MTFKELAVGQRFTNIPDGMVFTKINDDFCVNCNNRELLAPLTPVIPFIEPSQTPRTDAEYALNGEADNKVSFEFAKQLEQELSEALAREQKLRDDLEDIRTIVGKSHV